MSVHNSPTWIVAMLVGILRNHEWREDVKFQTLNVETKVMLNDRRMDGDDGCLCDTLTMHNEGCSNNVEIGY